MEKKFKLGVIGAGFMSTAIINGVIKGKTVLPQDIIVSDVSIEALERIKKVGVSVTEDNAYLASNAEFVLFAVKPQSLSAVLESIKGSSCQKFISIMAGVKRAKIKSVFPTALVARCMPNTPCAIGSGAVAIDLSDYKSEEDVNFIKGAFTSLAQIVITDEKNLNTVTGISGSSPAYFYMFAKGLIDAGVKRGLSYEDATKLVVGTLIGSGKMIFANPDKSLDDLIKAVCSKGGTTIEAVKVYEENDLSGISEKAVDACVKRAKELEDL